MNKNNYKTNIAILITLIVLSGCALISPPTNNANAKVQLQENGYYRITLAGTVAFNPAGLYLLPTKNQRAIICTKEISGDVSTESLRVFIKGDSWAPTETKSLKGKLLFDQSLNRVVVDLHYTFKPKSRSAWNFNGDYKMLGNRKVYETSDPAANIFQC